MSQYRGFRHGVAKAASGLWVLALSLAPLQPVLAAPFAYVAEGTANQVAVIDLADNSVVTHIAMASAPVGNAVSPDGRRAYMVRQNTGKVSVIDTATNAVIADVVVGNSPWSAVVSPDSTRVYVSNHADNTVSVIDATSNTAIATLPVSVQPNGLSISPDGTRLYIASSFAITVINPVTQVLITTIFNSSGLYNGIATSPDGLRTYAASAGTNTIAVVDNVTNALVGSVAVGLYPNGVVVSPDSRTIYASTLGGSNVAVIDAATLTVTATVPVGTRLYGIDVSADGTKVYAANYDSPPTLNVIDTATNTLTGTIALGGSGSTWAIGRFVAPALTAHVPDAPVLIGAVAGNGQATLTFNAPVSDGGSPITGYVGHCGSVTASGPSSPLVIGGLSNGTPYACFVTAINALGASVPSGSFTVTPITVPDPPTISGIVAGDHAVTVSFVAPAYDGSATITLYSALCGGLAASSPQSPISVSGLGNGVPVSCTVTALNAAGSSVASVPSDSVIPGIAASITSANSASGTYAAPFLFGVATAGDPAPTLALVAGALPPGLSFDAGSGTISGTPTSAASTVVTVSASNGVAAVASQDLSITIAAIVPDAPTIVAAQPGDGSVSVSFTPPAQTGGAPVTSYLAACGSQQTTQVQSPITVAGLVNGAPASCTVVANNSAGAGAVSAPLQATPRAPADLRVRVDHAGDFVPGGRPTSYTIVVTNAGANAVSAAHLTDTLDATFDAATWTCSGDGVALCPAPGGDGAIDSTIDLPPAASLTFVWTLTVALAPEWPVSNTATVTVPNAFSDTHPLDNSATYGPTVIGIFRSGFD